MFRIFLPLYLILIFFIIIFVGAVGFLPTLFLSSTMYKYEEQVTRGTFYLIEEELQGLNYSQQLQVIEKLQAQFGYPLRLVSPGDPLIDRERWEIVLSGQSIQLDIDDADYNIKKLRDSDAVIAISFSESEAENSHKQAKGTFYLIKEKLLNQPQEKWPAIIRELQGHFGVPIKLVKMDKLDHEIIDALDNKAEMKQSFNLGKIIYFENDDYDQYYAKKLEASPYVLQVGPIEAPFVALMSLIAGILFLFILGLAVALFLWIRPLWRSMNELSRTADDFGQGKLDSRAEIKSRSALSGLANQFNAMAERIGDLITGHRDLTNAVSHELRTPISRMRFGLEMLDKTDEKSRGSYLEGINMDVDDLEELVNELLHYARFEQSESLPSLETIEMIPWLEDIIDNARGYAGDLTINHLHNNVPTRLYSQCSPHYLTRVIHNLLRNACRYSQQQINVILDATESEIMIHVDDDGIGIPEQDRQRVFEPFYRLDKSRDRQSGGHGLGLAIAKRIMEAHDGSIVISDSPHGGARFTIAWPKMLP